MRAELIEHVGGHPNAAQRMLIERAAILALKCAQLDAAIIEGTELSLHATNHAIAWSNALRRTIAALGKPQSASQPPGAALDAHIARLRQRQRDGEAA